MDLIFYHIYIWFVLHYYYFQYLVFFSKGIGDWTFFISRNYCYHMQTNTAYTTNNTIP